MSAPTECPCEVFVHPRTIFNPPGRASLDYRVGDYVAFRHALLRSRPGETALTDWHPTEGSDLALQMLEWWAYLADVLAFYNERALQEVLLRTAVRPEDVRRIIRLLGYRPRPGIGATGVVAALTDSPRSFVIPSGFPLEGGSAPGEPAQIFELDGDVEIGELGRPLPFSARFSSAPGGLGTTTWTGPAPRDATGFFVNFFPARVLLPPGPGLTVQEGELFKFTLDGAITNVKRDDVILVLKRSWDGEQPSGSPAGLGESGYALVTVRDVIPFWDQVEHAYTEVTAVSAHNLPEGLAHSQYRILRATKLAHLWLYHDRYPGSSDPSLMDASLAQQFLEGLFSPFAFIFGGGPPSQPIEDPRVLAGASLLDNKLGAAHLEGITRGISAGDPVLFEKTAEGGLNWLFKQISGGFLGALLQQLLDYFETPRPQLVKVTGYSEQIWYANAPQSDRYGQGPPIGPPSNSSPPIPIPHSKLTFAANGDLDRMAQRDQGLKAIVIHYGWKEVGQLIGPPAPGKPTAVDVPAPPALPAGRTAPVLVTDAIGNGVPGWIGTTGSTFGKDLVPPLRALLHLLPVSRGQTVSSEILGSGDPTLIGQEFVLKRSPLTYLAGTGPRSFNGYRSTLRVRVDWIEWREVPSFYGVAPDARVFVTREDDEQKTHVRFGDGENGARLPAGRENVVAQYRYGSGAAVPPVGTLTSILKPQPGLQAIENPVAPGGGADPDPPEQVRRYAPRSVLTFGRAVSGDDYEAVAAQTPGVRRARSYFSWDGASQRSLVKVFVGDDDAVVAAATEALRAFADPNRPVLVALAAPLYPDLRLTLEVDPAYDPDLVQAAVITALLDPRAEPFGTEVVQIGQIVYDSYIYDACLRVPGVVAVRGLEFRVWIRVPVPILDRLDAWWSARGLGFEMADQLRLDSGKRHSPGEGNFYLLRGDRLHVSAEVARHGE